MNHLALRLGDYKCDIYISLIEGYIPWLIKCGDIYLTGQIDAKDVPIVISSITERVSVGAEFEE